MMIMTVCTLPYRLLECIMTMTYKEKIDKFTFLVPIFNLEGDRLENFKFVLSKLAETEANILVVEQVKDKRKKSTPKELCKKLNVDYLPVKISSNAMNKSMIINHAVDIINTEFVWVNDVDCYLKFNKIIKLLDFTKDFIQPYTAISFLIKKISKKIKNNQKCSIEFNKSPHDIVGCMYGALSFIFSKKAFLDIGGMDEDINLYHEDTELCYRIIQSGYNIDILKNEFGIHLYHNYESNKSNIIMQNANKIETKYNTPLHIIRLHIQQYYDRIFL